jgi:hypothetical protein
VYATSVSLYCVGSGASNSAFGPGASPAELETARARITRTMSGWEPGKQRLNPTSWQQLGRRPFRGTDSRPDLHPRARVAQPDRLQDLGTGPIQADDTVTEPEHRTVVPGRQLSAEPGERKHRRIVVDLVQGVVGECQRPPGWMSR